jgi:putative protease
METITETPQRLIGKVLTGSGDGRVRLDVRNKFYKGEAVQVLTRRGPAREDRIMDLSNEDGLSVEYAQPNSRVTVVLQGTCETHDLIRRSYRNPGVGIKV